MDGCFPPEVTIFSVLLVLSSKLFSSQNTQAVYLQVVKKDMKLVVATVSLYKILKIFLLFRFSPCIIGRRAKSAI